MSVPAPGKWTQAARPLAARTQHSQSTLKDGRVLVVGGKTHFKVNPTTEFYTPNVDAWSAGPALPNGVFAHTQSTLHDGRVLIAGGRPDNSSGATSVCWVLDPCNGTWETAASMSVPRKCHGACVLDDGRVLVTGGLTDNETPLATTEVFDPANNLWTPAAPMSKARHGHGQSALHTGEVLVCSTTSVSPDHSCEVYSPKMNSWEASIDIGDRESYQTPLCGVLCTLDNGEVLVCGGCEGGAVKAAQIYNHPFGTWTMQMDMRGPRDQHTASLLLDGRVLVTGGVLKEASAETFTRSRASGADSAQPPPVPPRTMTRSDRPSTAPSPETKSGKKSPISEPGVALRPKKGAQQPKRQPPASVVSTGGNGTAAGPGNSDEIYQVPSLVRESIYNVDVDIPEGLNVGGYAALEPDHEKYATLKPTSNADAIYEPVQKRTPSGAKSAVEAGPRAAANLPGRSGLKESIGSLQAVVGDLDRAIAAVEERIRATPNRRDSAAKMGVPPIKSQLEELVSRLNALE